MAKKRKEPDPLEPLRGRVMTTMRRRKWRAADLCRAAKLPKATISRFLNAASTNIDYATVAKLEAAIK